MPLPFNVATVVLLDAQIADPETFPVLLSEKVPVAVKMTGVPLGVEGVEGLMEIPVSAAAVTVIFAPDEVMLSAVAVTVVLPTVTPVATPVVLSIVAILLLAEAQVA